jgi:hypothetical protein
MAEQEMSNFIRVVREAATYPARTRAVPGAQGSRRAAAQTRPANHPPNLKQRLAKPGTT